jgi:ribonuclease HII
MGKGPQKIWPDPEPDTFSLERSLRRKGYLLIAGLDEVGRGPLAGPVVAACVILPQDCDYHRFVDSKILPAKDRARLYEELKQNGASISIGVVSESEIDRLNILQASLLAMKNAVVALAKQPDFLLVDGKFPVPMALPQQTLVKGESKSASIAAASIAAKVERDKLMADYHRKYPAYSFDRNKGYPTAEHRKAIQTHGPCAIHRQSFKCVKEYIVNSDQYED